MTNKEREEIYKAINNVSNKINDTERKLDKIIQLLSNETNESLVDIENALCELSMQQ